MVGAVVGDGIGAHGWGNQLARKTALSYFRSRGTGTCGHDGTHNLVYGQQILVPEHLVEQKTPEIAHHLGLHRSTLLHRPELQLELKQTRQRRCLHTYRDHANLVQNVP